MNFFNKDDFEYYSSVIGSTYKSGTTMAEVLKKRLTQNGVFDKTKYWAQLIERKGYPIESRNAWQDYLKVRSYTWAKIYLPGYENTQVYFTIGVGSRLTKDSKVLSLETKIDCQRKKGDLVAYQTQAFDDFRDANIDPWKIEISKEELESYNWDSLVDETIDFIEANKKHYKELVQQVWPNGIGVLPKVTRLCWNEFGWEKPSGPEGKSKSRGHAFESDKGYGHEEWLFDLDRIINGYHYGFIQAFNKVPKHEGKTFDVHLFALKKPEDNTQGHEYFWIGRINKTEVLNSKQKDEVLKMYKDNGWYNQMLDELALVDVPKRDLEIVSEEDLFNVRFKFDDDSFTKFDEPILIENPKEEIGRGLHYVLMDLITETISVKNTTRKYKFRSGHNPTKTGSTKSTYKAKTVNRTLIHKDIQEFMYKYFIKEYGKDKVGTEVPTGIGTSIDVVVKQSDGADWFYEVKTFTSPLLCIREAFGQILEYAMYSTNNHASKLIIVGVNSPSISVKKYLNHLRNSTNLDIYYQVFDLESNTLVKKLY